MPRPTRSLAIAPDSVLVEDGDGVRAFDARDGDVRWRSMGQHLAATAPDALSQDVVVLDDLEGTLTGVDLVDGTVRWTLPGPAPTGVPVFVVPVGSDLAVVGSSGWVALVDVADGRLAWSVGGRRTTAETPVAVSVAHVVTQVQPDDAPTPVLRVRGLGGEVSAEVPLRTEESLRDVVVTARLLVVRTTAGLTAHRLDGGELQWRRDDLPGRLAAARPVTTPPPGFPGIRPGLGTVATRSLAVVVLGNDGTARVLDDRTGEVVRTLGEPVEDGLRFGGGFLTHRRLWRVDAGALEVHDLASGDRVLRIEVGAPPTVVTTNPVVIATSGRLVRIDVDAAAAEEPDDQ
jgi:outer membrane protein assembly factor BamB